MVLRCWVPAFAGTTVHLTDVVSPNEETVLNRYSVLGTLIIRFSV
jgi:hypothetical protein